MLVVAEAWESRRSGTWGSRNGVDWYRLDSYGWVFRSGGSYPVVDTELAPPPEP